MKQVFIFSDEKFIECVLIYKKWLMDCTAHTVWTYLTAHVEQVLSASCRARTMLCCPDFLFSLSNELLCLLIVDLVPSSLLEIFVVPVFKFVLKARKSWIN